MAQAAWSSREEALVAIQRSGQMLEHADASLKRDRGVVLAAVQKRGRALQWAHVSLTMDAAVVLAAVRQNGLALKHAHASLTMDASVVLAAVKQRGLALQFAHCRLREDRSVVLAAVRQNGLALKHAGTSLTQDVGVVLVAVRNDGRALLHAHPSLCRRAEVVLAAVQQDGAALAFADYSLQKDKALVLQAVRQNGGALYHAAAPLRRNKEVVLAAVRQMGAALEHADGILKLDTDVVQAAVQQDPQALCHADALLRFVPRSGGGESMLGGQGGVPPGSKLVPHPAWVAVTNTKAAVDRHARAPNVAAVAAQAGGARSCTTTPLGAVPGPRFGTQWLARRKVAWRVIRGRGNVIYRHALTHETRVVRPMLCVVTDEDPAAATAAAAGHAASQRTAAAAKDARVGRGRPIHASGTLVGVRAAHNQRVGASPPYRPGARLSGAGQQRPGLQASAASMGMLSERPAALSDRRHETLPTVAHNCPHSAHGEHGRGGAVGLGPLPQPAAGGAKEPAPERGQGHAAVANQGYFEIDNDDAAAEEWAAARPPTPPNLQATVPEPVQLGNQRSRGHGDTQPGGTANVVATIVLSSDSENDDDGRGGRGGGDGGGGVSGVAAAGTVVVDPTAAAAGASTPPGLARFKKRAPGQRARAERRKRKAPSGGRICATCALPTRTRCPCCSNAFCSVACQRPHWRAKKQREAG